MMSSMPVLIFGTAGAAKAVYYWIKASNEAGNTPVLDVIGFVEREGSLIGQEAFGGKKIVACDDNVAEFIRDYDRIGAIVPFGSPFVKEKVTGRLREHENIAFPNVIHPSVIMDRDGGTIGEGNYIGPGTVFESEYSLGNHNYIGNGSQFGHDIRIGDHNSIYAAVAVAGNVTMGDRCEIGLNSSIIQELDIASGTVLGAGTVVTKTIDVPGTYVGAPARKVR